MNLELRILKAVLIISLAFLASTVNAQEVKKIKIIELEKTIKESKTPLIVNFWATFCKPCLEEMPYFQALAKKNNVTLLLVSLDLEKSYPARIKSYIVKNKYTAPVFWLVNTMQIISVRKLIHPGQVQFQLVFF